MNRFWSKVLIGAPDECWLWKGGTHRQGYGFFKYRGRSFLAHRVSYCLENGIDFWTFDPSIKILHSCDNEPCCNPAHLSDGTQKDNVHDMIAKGRRGVCSAKLSVEQVISIRTDSRPCVVIAEENRISLDEVYAIISGRRWGTITSGIKVPLTREPTVRQKEILERDKTVFSMYYENRKTMKNIATEIGLSRPRVSQILNRKSQV